MAFSRIATVGDHARASAKVFVLGTECERAPVELGNGVGTENATQERPGVRPLRERETEQAVVPRPQRALAGAGVCHT